MQLIEHLYIHVPFRPRICPYCSFYVQPADNRVIPGLVDAILMERRHRKKQFSVTLKTIFVGGGTPSALSTSELYRLLSGLELLVPVREFTIEINPTTVSLEKARMMRECGVTRASLGAQSFVQKDLTTLGRQHSPEKIRRSYEILREAGFKNINIDLIFGVPGQTLNPWDESLAGVLTLAPEHISAYCLTYEEDTPFFDRLSRGEWQRSDAWEAGLFCFTSRRLKEAGYEHYEVSNYARSGYESIHNLAYWRGKDFLGLGPSAVSTAGERRWKNIADTAHYVVGAQSGDWAETDIEILSGDLRQREKLMFGLRTKEGVEMCSGFNDEFQRLQASGYAECIEGRWRLTENGLLRADAIAELFLP